MSDRVGQDVEGRPTAIIVVGCGKAKAAEARPARELYTSTLFQLARRYAEASGKPWVIASAAHGVIEPEVVLRPYDHRLPNQGSERTRWARVAACRLEVKLSGKPDGERIVEILAGAAYSVPLMLALEELGIHSTQPLARLGLGKRLGKLKWMAEFLQMQRASALTQGRVDNGQVR